MKNFPPIPFLVTSVALVAVGVLTPLNLKCPVCDGTGYLKAAQNLTVKDTSIQLIKETPVYTFGECGMPVKRIKFTYSVNMTVVNTGNAESKGTVKISFSRHPPGFKTYIQDGEGNMVEVEYQPPTVPAFLDVPAGQTKNIQMSLTYVDDPPVPGDPAPQASVSAGEDVTDPTCAGTGILSFPFWIGAKLKPPTVQ